ncbi:hypothetical protein BJV74DRAFT_799567 [Russula compacta]|nr:hypothetical protein BJV74DRAFT_799567 [Russula compacta]
MNVNNRETNVSTKKRKEVKDHALNYIPAAKLILGSFGCTLFNPESERGTGQGVRGEAGKVEVDVHGQKQKFGKGHTLFNLGQEREALGKRLEMRLGMHSSQCPVA